jgi:aminoglycoside phosphotransferase (APT) family kinase protein
MRTIGVLRGADLPSDAEAAVHSLYVEACRKIELGMISHLDAAPKNLLVYEEGRPGALLDFELGAGRSDPAYDPGFLVGHYLLMGENRPEMRPATRRAARAVLAGYRRVRGGADRKWERRLARYAGLVLLYRLYGSSPAPYLSSERYAAIREAGLHILLTGDLPEPESAK